MTEINASQIGVMFNAGFGLNAECYRETCRHKAQLELAMPAEILGRSHSTLRKDLRPRLRCSRRGGRDIGLWSSGGARGPNGEAYGGER